MPPDTVAYLLLAVAVLVVAAVLTLPLVLLLWVVGRLRRKPADRGPRRPAERSSREPAPEGGSTRGQRVLRRCDDCGLGWKGVPGRDKTVAGLKVRRWVRRRARARKVHGPSWSKRQGWSRCPSCLSTNVRTSSRHAADV